MAKKGKFVTVRNSAIIAASAAAAVASAWDRTHKRVTGAVLTETDLRVERLSDLRQESEMLAEIQQGLEREWGSFAFLGFKDVYEMAVEAGRTTFVVVERGEESASARGIVQTTLTDVHGDPELLEEAYPSFQSLTAPEAWRNARHHGGDTAVLLQITTLGPTERGGGIGSLLRNAVLNMLPKHVKYALTTTPVDGTKAESIDTEDTSTFTPAMRFHARGGANPTRILPGYKTPAPDATPTAHGQDIVVMRYARDDEGNWPAKRPPMRVRSVGPLQERMLRTGRRLRVRGLEAPRPKISLRSLPTPSLPRPHIAMPKVHVVGNIKSGASKLRRRDGKPEDDESQDRPSEDVSSVQAAQS
jgi:hypothetical protein